MKTIFRQLSVFVGVFSLISFVQHIFDVGVFALASELIEYYRSIMYFFLGFPARLLGYSFPPELMDFWTLSFIGAASYVKTKNIEFTRFFRVQNNFTYKAFWRFGLLVTFGVSGIGVLILISAITPSTYIDELHEEPLDVMQGAAKNALMIFAGAILFFLFNAFAPSVVV